MEAKLYYPTSTLSFTDFRECSLTFYRWRQRFSERYIVKGFDGGSAILLKMQRQKKQRKQNGKERMSLRGHGNKYKQDPTD